MRNNSTLSAHCLLLSFGVLTPSDVCAISSAMHMANKLSLCNGVLRVLSQHLLGCESSLKEPNKLNSLAVQTVWKVESSFHFNVITPERLTAQSYTPIALALCSCSGWRLSQMCWSASALVVWCWTGTSRIPTLGHCCDCQQHWPCAGQSSVVRSWCWALLRAFQRT